jgi:hypothetical protein
MSMGKNIQRPGQLATQDPSSSVLQGFFKTREQAGEI